VPYLADPTPFAEIGELSVAALQVWMGTWMEPAARRRQAQQRLALQIQSARTRAPLYRRLYRDLPAAAGAQPALTDLPVVTKTMLMADLPATFTDPSLDASRLAAFLADDARVGELFAGRYAVWTSSGTSGVPGVFLHDRFALAIYEALETLRFRGLSSLADYGMRILGGERFALVMVTGGHFASVSSIEHVRQSYPWLADSVRAFSLVTPLAELVEQLNAYRPTVLATYPTAAEALAAEQKAGRLRLHLTELLTGGEYLAECARTHLEAVFGCPVRNGYGASECLSLAWGCGHGSLHVNDDWVVLEPVDEAYRPVSPGVPSFTTLLTNLANRIQPLIRYDLGDSITQLPPCACGSTFPSIRVEGRHDDVLHLATHDGRTVDFLPLVLTTVLEDDAHVFDFQLTQTDADCVKLALGVAQHEAAECARTVLAGFLARNHVGNVRIEIDTLAPARSPRSGKLRRIVCAVASAAAPGCDMPPAAPPEPARRRTRRKAMT
jgi:phenylacetate-coenzyme A ligase PaaK-like adenylate-forming protein